MQFVLASLPSGQRFPSKMWTSTSQNLMKYWKFTWKEAGNMLDQWAREGKHSNKAWTLIYFAKDMMYTDQMGRFYHVSSKGPKPNGHMWNWQQLHWLWGNAWCYQTNKSHTQQWCIGSVQGCYMRELHSRTCPIKTQTSKSSWEDNPNIRKSHYCSANGSLTGFSYAFVGLPPSTTHT